MQVNVEIIAHVASDGSYGDAFFDIDYDVPKSAINKNTGNPIEIKFKAAKGSVADGVFDIRLLKKT